MNLSRQSQGRIFKEGKERLWKLEFVAFAYNLFTNKATFSREVTPNSPKYFLEMSDLERVYIYIYIYNIIIWM